jgi:hypothetical protein
MRNNRRLVRDGLLAVVAGSAIGVSAALWSAPARPAAAPASSTRVLTPAEARGAAGDDAAAIPTDAAKPDAPRAQPADVQPIEGDETLQRARTMAEQPDVSALIALREDVARRARERGEADAADNKRRLARLDAYLQQARQLQLKRDAELFRKAAAATSGRR